MEAIKLSRWVCLLSNNLLCHLIKLNFCFICKSFWHSKLFEFGAFSFGSEHILSWCIILWWFRSYLSAKAPESSWRILTSSRNNITPKGAWKYRLHITLNSSCFSSISFSIYFMSRESLPFAMHCCNKITLLQFCVKLYCIEYALRPFIRLLLG